MFCPKCGNEAPEGTKFCASCGNPLGAGAAAPAAAPAQPVAGGMSANASFESYTTPQGTQVTTINVQTPDIKKNGIGTAGFVLALIGVFLSWVPVLGWIIWILGAILSVVGLFRMPRGMAIAGVVLSFIDIILLLFVMASCGAVGIAFM